MSYDMYVRCVHCDTTVVELGNYTSNMGAFFIHFGVGPRFMDGVAAQTFEEALDSALERIQAESLGTGIALLKRRFDAPNGWGDVESATAWLREMRAKLRELTPQQRRTLVIRSCF